jgi:hypothetical protein
MCETPTMPAFGSGSSACLIRKMAAATSDLARER